MPTKTLLRLTLLAGLVAPLCAFALGVGPLTVRSALNENFEAEIPLIVNNPGELTGLTVRVPRQQDFDQAGIERLAFLSKLRFSVEAPPGGPNLVKIRSIEPVREPNFNLLLELVWSRGRLIREFTVQVDPELYANRRLPPPPLPAFIPPPPVAAPVAAAPRPALNLPPAPSVSFEGATTYGPVRPGETLMAVANRARPSASVSLPQMMSILLAGNPGAFANGNPSALRAGTLLKVPTAQALGVQGAATPPPTAPSLAATTPPAVIPSVAVPPSPPALPPVAAPPIATPPVVAPPIATPPIATPPVAVSPPPVAGSGSSAIPPPSVTAPSTLSSAEQPREIIPQATIPQPEASPPPTAATAAPPDAAPSKPEPARPTPAKPAPQPVAEDESWMANPVLWVAVILILLAIAAMILLPLLRKPARAKPVAKTAGAPAEPARDSAPEPEDDTATTQVQVREASLTRPLLAPGPALSPTEATRAGAAAVAAMAAAPTGGSPQPKSVTELLRDIDFGTDAPPVFGGGAPSPALSLERLPDAEPVTASATRKPAGPLSAPEPPTEPELLRKAAPPTDLPSELRLDDIDFDFGSIGLQQTGSQSVELPPLEMKPTTPGGRAAGLPPGIDKPEPATEPASISTISAILSAQSLADAERTAPPTQPQQPSAADRRFEFADVTQEIAKHTDEPSLRLTEDLPDFNSQTLDLSKMGATQSVGVGDASDYVETKLDLATAYLDMGDQVGARGLLDEVLSEGSDSQKRRAAELLKKVAG